MRWQQRVNADGEEKILTVFIGGGNITLQVDDVLWIVDRKEFIKRLFRGELHVRKHGPVDLGRR